MTTPPNRACHSRVGPRTVRVEDAERRDDLPVTVEWDRRGSPLDYVLSANLHRRHLNVTQRAMVGARMANMRREDNLLRGPDVQKDTSEDRNEKVSLQQAADVMGVGRVYVSHARTVLERGTPEEIATAKPRRRRSSPVNSRVVSG